MSFGLGPGIAIYEPGFLRAVVAYHRAGLLPAGSFVKLYLCADSGLSGSPFGLPPTIKALDAYLEMLDGTGLAWAVSAVGDDLCRTPVCAAALERGGHLHIGLEFYGGDRTPTNVSLVHEAVAACEAAGRPVASPDQAAEVLGLAVA
ncbi:MAG: 3-keto-5-aminohexanoate cleavage protein [Ilumatobacteraceae bacterium]